ncbi:hypothetical protein JQX09_17745 [Sulfitobacter pseudonitzschiae]|uniref:Uncharacterized protein n=1 Tax=Pseudosulfitobacter pseudonitzschiae TaxID=1402135 RepID=A0A9Q2NQI3_9RHOB|nr:hypothetical protein [Pseudosulfitobacter pseudonitzschiae]MBM2293774.1 hypothetical protein [Pseudosulfitobacter pseudonitzschiae]MBM2298692.1 hypothetical protein [Pseudosulfitobacter pseudonitzschiae]MBM2303606.1 hypothetical protein [Pseudosulfitobacter pseudonitzschiae]MBM2313389.1 hypothetical protein [Pseudosulfitobacter pseudonitzschiae]MBM2318302.1 hypothetical protein [Pseudosulfitobacter pseudonitzschiae]
MSVRKINFCCKTCGSDDIVFDSSSDWNAETQSYEHRDCYDHPPICNSDDCMGEEVQVEIVDIATGEKLDSVYGHNGVALQYLPIAEAKEIERIRSEQRAAEREQARAQEQAARLAISNAETLALGYEAMP